MEKLTERLRLREFTEQDVDAIAEFRKDPRYLEFYYRPAYSREECKRFVDMCIGWSQEKPRCKFQLAITDRSSGALLGTAGCGQTISVAGEVTLAMNCLPLTGGTVLQRRLFERCLISGFRIWI